MPAKSKERKGGGSSTKPKRTFTERNGAFMTPEEVADELGVTVRMAKRLCHNGTLKSSHIGKLLRIHRDDLAAYIAQVRAEDGS
jgi:excisionase family DNA binding protein